MKDSNFFYMEKKIYIAVVGPTAAGKETVFKIVKEIFGPYPNVAVGIHRFSDPLNEMLDLMHLPKSRPNQQLLSTVLRQAFGENLLGKILEKRARNNPAKIVFLDGVRRPKDVEMLKTLGGENAKSFLLYIDAPIEERHKRLRLRADRPDDAEKTFEDFLKEQSAEPELLITSLKEHADWVLDNSASDKEFKLLKLQVAAFWLQKVEKA